MATEQPSSISANKNLKSSLIALGFFIASAIVGFIAQDMFSPNSDFFLWLFIGLAVFLLTMAAVFSSITLVRVLREIRKNDHARNYTALIISLLVFGFVVYEVFSRLIF